MSNTTRAPSTRKTVPGMGRIFQRGQTFWIAYYRHGKEHRESTHSVNENDGDEALEEAIRRDRQPAIRRAARRAGDVRGSGERHRARLHVARPPIDEGSQGSHGAPQEWTMRHNSPRTVGRRTHGSCQLSNECDPKRLCRHGFDFSDGGTPADARFSSCSLKLPVFNTWPWTTRVHE